MKESNSRGEGERLLERVLSSRPFRPARASKVEQIHKLYNHSIRVLLITSSS